MIPRPELIDPQSALKRLYMNRRPKWLDDLNGLYDSSFFTSCILDPKTWAHAKDRLSEPLISQIIDRAPRGLIEQLSDYSCPLLIFDDIMPSTVLSHDLWISIFVLLNPYNLSQLQTVCKEFHLDKDWICGRSLQDLICHERIHDVQSSESGLLTRCNDWRFRTYERIKESPTN